MSIKDRGFASMSNEKRRAIASKGGIMAHVQGTAHTWDSKTARAAGKKGARVRAERKRLQCT